MYRGRVFVIVVSVTRKERTDMAKTESQARRKGSTRVVNLLRAKLRLPKPHRLFTEHDVLALYVTYVLRW